jgi:hypothetical protein
VGRRALPPPPGGWEKAIADAIQRLKEEKPLNPHLLRQAKLGRLSIGPSIVAREAGCPRDYISHESCRFPDLYQAIKALQKPVVGPRSLAEVNLKLRQRNRELLDSIKVARAQVAAALLRMDQMAKDYDRKLNELERIQKRRGADPNRVAGRSRDHGKVLELPAPSIEGQG